MNQLSIYLCYKCVSLVDFILRGMMWLLYLHMVMSDLIWNIFVTQ